MAACYCIHRLYLSFVCLSVPPFSRRNPIPLFYAPVSVYGILLCLRYHSSCGGVNGEFSLAHARSAHRYYRFVLTPPRLPRGDHGFAHLPAASTPPSSLCVRQARSFEAKLLNQDRMTPELYTYKNKAGGLVILYSNDESEACHVSFL